MAELDGRPVTLDELQTLALTNYGHFTSFRVDDGKVRGLSLHLERLKQDCKALFGVLLDADELRHLTRRAVPEQGSVTVRVTVFDPSTDLGVPSRANDPKILVTTRPAAHLPLPPITVQSVPYVREEPQIKSVGLYGALRQRRAAQLNGFDDALFVDDLGHVIEGGTWNIGFFDGRNVVWPEGHCLEGITMRLLTQASHRRKPLSLRDLGKMEAAFATNAAIGVRPITRIDDTILPSDVPIFDSLRSAYLGVEPDSI